MNHLTQEEFDRFNEEGYLIFEGLFDDDLNQRIKDDVDQLMIDRKNGERPILMAYPELGALTSEPSVVDRVADLMEEKNSFTIISTPDGNYPENGVWPGIKIMHKSPRQTARISWCMSSCI